MATADSTTTYKAIPGFPGYRVGDDGSVWSARRTRGRADGKRGSVSYIGDTWKPLREKTHPCGHKQVSLCLGGKPITRFVHRLVLEAFVGPPPGGMACCHGDGNAANNHLANLRWGSPKANSEDMVRHGRSTRGERNPCAKLTHDRVRSIRARHAGGVSIRRIAADEGLNPSTIKSAISGVTWSHV